MGLLIIRGSKGDVKPSTGSESSLFEIAIDELCLYEVATGKTGVVEVTGGKIAMAGIDTDKIRVDCQGIFKRTIHQFSATKKRVPNLTLFKRAPYKEAKVKHCSP